MIEVKIENGVTSTNKISGSVVVKTDGESSIEEIKTAVTDAEYALSLSNDVLLKTRTNLNYKIGN